MAFGRTYCFGPDVPGREEQDAPAPHRVLDDGAGVGLRHARGRDRARGAACWWRWWRGSSSGGPRSSRSSSATPRSSSASGPRSRACTTTRRSSGCTRPGTPFEWGDDFGAPDETLLSEQFETAGVRDELPGGGQGLLHGARPGRPAALPLVRLPGPGGLRRDHRRGPAHGLARAADPAHRRARAAAGGLRVVQGPAPLRLACRTPASASASSAPSPGSPGWSTCARPSRSRGCSTG